MAQCIHAAGESSDCVSPGTYAIALAAKDEQHLRDIADRLTAQGIEHTLIEENDAPHAGEATAIGIKPGRRSTLKRYVSSLPLLR